MYDNNLNYAQYKSITSKFKFNIIIAGAGSGKTRVITNRIAWLVKKNRIKGNSICAITFTNKASIEMKIRLKLLLNEKINNIYIGTFHSLGYRILYFYYKLLRCNNNFQIIDDNEQSIIIKKINCKYKLYKNQYDNKFVQSFINKKKNQGIRAKNIIVNNTITKHLFNIYNIYEIFCSKNMLVDFSEILLRSYEILSFNKKIRNIYQKIFLHFLVDEFQDTNHIQYEWLKVLTLKSKSIAVVCDDDQLIYGWRGANIENIKLFKKNYKNVCLFYLEQNYRCSSNILSVANSVILNNKKRFNKKLWSLKHYENNISLYQAKDDINECFYIIYEIRKLIKKNINLNNICVLYRSKFQSKLLEEYFIKEKIPYIISGKKNFYQKHENKIIINYIKLILDFKNNNLFFNILDISNNISKKKILNIIKIISLKKNITYMQSIIKIYKTKVSDIFFKKYMSYISNILKVLNNLYFLYNNEICLNKIFKYIVKNISFANILQIKKSLIEERVSNIKLFYYITKKFLFIKEFSNFKESLKEIYLYLSLLLKKETGNINNSINLMTIHAAKGLEFDYTFIYALEEGIFPIIKEKEEERRLFYVAITRTKKRLYLTYSKLRQIVLYKKIQNASRFFIEIPNILIKKKIQNIMYKFNKTLLNYKIGRKVFHKSFGVGNIIKHDNKNEYIYVNFNKYGEKKLYKKHTNIKLL